jgi:putative membrane protein
MIFRRLIGNYARGLLMGGADVIPGVSGGTVALIVGIYERLIHAIRLGASALLSGVRLNFAEARRKFGELEWLLVLPLGAGILTALVIGARIIPPLIEEHPEPVYALFFGLIVGSVIVPFRRIERVGRVEVLMVALAAVAAFVLVGIPPQEFADPSLVYVFVAAMVAICAMILPGVSGAFLLHVMGIYTTSLDALRNLDLPYVLTFVGGAFVGLASFARILEWLLVHRHGLTMAALTGLMVGSVRALWPWQTADREILMPPDPGSFLAMAAIAAAGFIGVSLLIWYGGRRVERPVRVNPPTH